MGKINYRGVDLTTKIRVYDGKSALKLYNKMLKGEMYENYIFSTNREINVEKNYIFIFDYIDCYGDELEHPEIHIQVLNASKLKHFISLSDFNSLTIKW